MNSQSHGFCLSNHITCKRNSWWNGQTIEVSSDVQITFKQLIVSDLLSYCLTASFLIRCLQLIPIIHLYLECHYPLKKIVVASGVTSVFIVLTMY